jgi:dihydrofolate synthase/folylpolyglutamate synthase
MNREDWPPALYQLMQSGKKRLPRPQSMQRRMVRLLERAGHPEKNLKLITVGGTNGKGSVSTLLAACLEGTGNPVGLFVSPHLVFVGERIRIQGRPLSYKALDRLSRQILQWVEEGEREFPEEVPSFFESLLVLALLAFQEYHVEFVVLEAGLGGYRDATSCIPSILGVLTSVHQDHQRELGNTVSEILKDKIGVGDPSRVLVYGDFSPTLLAELESLCQEKKIQAFPSTPYRSQLSWKALHPRSGQEGFWENIPFLLPFWGEKQRKNVEVVLTCLEFLEKREGHQRKKLLPWIRKAYLPGRFHWIEGANGTPPWIFDIAHNQEALEVFEEMLSPLIPYEQRSLICGISQDKFYEPFLSQLAKLAPSVVFVAASHRGESPHILKEKAKRFFQQCSAYEKLEEGFSAFLQSSPTQVRLVTGSVFLVGEILNELTRREPQFSLTQLLFGKEEYDELDELDELHEKRIYGTSSSPTKTY